MYSPPWFRVLYFFIYNICYDVQYCSFSTRACRRNMIWLERYKHHTSTIHALYMHCIVYRILHVWCISAFRGICNIFKSFWKRCLTHQLLEFSVCLCSFSKIAYYNLGINLFFTLLLQYIFSTYKLNCVVWYTVLIYSIYDMIFFNNFYFTLFIHLRQSTTQQPTAWWHDTVRLDRTNRLYLP